MSPVLWIAAAAGRHLAGASVPPLEDAPPARHPGNPVVQADQPWEDRGQVCDEAGRPLPGFERSEPITGDSTDAPVSWSVAAEGPPAGRTLRLSFTLRRAKLFSYWWQ